MNENDLKYFKDLIEGKTDITWKVFWKLNEKRFKKNLTRQDFLKLKFGKLERASEILNENNISFQWTEKADYHLSISNLSDGVCDENGYPIVEIQRKLFNGAVGDFIDGNIETGRIKFANYLEDIQQMGNMVEQSERIKELEFDAVSFIKQGNIEVGIEMLKLLVATFDNENDLIQPTIDYVKTEIKRINNKRIAGLAPTNRSKPN